MVSIHRPLSYEPSTLPLRHAAYIISFHENLKKNNKHLDYEYYLNINVYKKQSMYFSISI